MKPPPKYKTALMIWVAIYPTITIMMYLLGGLLKEMPLPLRTFILTVIVVPLMVYVLLPLTNRLFHTWLRK